MVRWCYFLCQENISSAPSSLYTYAKAGQFLRVAIHNVHQWVSEGKQIYNWQD